MTPDQVKKRISEIRDRTGRLLSEDEYSVDVECVSDDEFRITITSAFNHLEIKLDPPRKKE
jgi:hypothetical protein